MDSQKKTLRVKIRGLMRRSVSLQELYHSLDAKTVNEKAVVRGLLNHDHLNGREFVRVSRARYGINPVWERVQLISD